MTTGEKIKEARKKAGMTQAELGALLGVSGSMIGQWENDFRHPKLETRANSSKAVLHGFCLRCFSFADSIFMYLIKLCISSQIMTLIFSKKWEFSNNL